MPDSVSVNWLVGGGKVLSNLYGEKLVCPGRLWDAYQQAMADAERTYKALRDCPAEEPADRAADAGDDSLQ